MAPRIEYRNNSNKTIIIPRFRDPGSKVLWTIGARLFLAMLASFGLILGGYLVLDMRQTHEEFHRIEKRTLSAFMPGLANLVDSSMLSGRREHIDEVFERMVRTGPFASIELLDPARKAVRVRDFRGSAAPGKSETLSSAPEHHAAVEFPVAARPSCLRCHGPGERILGYVRIVAPLERSKGMLARHLRARLAIGSLALVLAGIFAAAFLRSMLQAPLQRILRAMDRVREGDLEARLEPDLPGELSLVARRFNAMAQRLREGREDLDELYRRQVAHMDRLASLGELGANFAHEVRNPLTGIGSAIQVLRQGLAPQDQRREVLDKVLAQVDRINKTLENFLHFSRMSEARRRVFDPAEPLSRVRFLLESRARSQGTRLEVEAPQGLPPVFGDPAQLEQVLLNLGLNALQALGSGGRLGLRERAEADGGLLVEVQDDGPGIAPDSIEKVFEPFYTTRKEGSGLGLSIARRIAEDHGGELWLESVPGEGTTAFLRLPPRPREGRERRAQGRSREAALT